MNIFSLALLLIPQRKDNLTTIKEKMSIKFGHPRMPYCNVIKIDPDINPSKGSGHWFNQWFDRGFN
ncbi:hypothetical protein HS088_TW11G00006 [Tripterygium wilfordii]|uniref:Uncharacterized protein n=1 Tax=Tripterygium wilfordii TaxID=458696 RepID=A0A7J7D0T7_TRIWF|nr:hypothetical protein HS088_TW11G00006 [Tripterygium wilfordii]